MTATATSRPGRGGAGATAAATARSQPGPTAARALPDAPIGAVPIVWNNADLAGLAPPVPADQVLDEIARLGFDGTQTGIGFPQGAALREALEARGLRLAEVYAALPCTSDGPTDAALDEGRRRLQQLHAAGGEVLVVALAFARERDTAAGGAMDPATPRLSDAGWRRLAAELDRLAAEARALGHPLAFHLHAGTYVETPAELDRLVAETDPDLVRLCLDVGHSTVGGGDPAEAIRRHGDRIVHVHLKDVDPIVLDRLRTGATTGFLDALRERVFTELGAGVLDLEAVIDALAGRDYRGWLMVEQDTTWRPPSESAAIGRSVLAYELRRAARRLAATEARRP